MTSLPQPSEDKGRLRPKSSIWNMSEDERREAIVRRAAQGAKRALGRRDYIRIEPTPPPVYPKPQIEVPANGRMWKRILAEVAIEHGIPVVLILGRQRNVPIKLARHHAMFRIATETKMSLMEIGRCMDRDHTTVIAGIAAHKRRASQAQAADSPLSPVFTGSGQVSLTLGVLRRDGSC